MGASLPRSRRSNDPQPEINITPLVDVVLVLLVIFMVVTPSLLNGEHIDLPKVLQVDKKKDQNPINVTITVDNLVVVEETHVSLTDLKPTLEKLHAADDSRKLLLKTDKNVPYKNLRRTFKIAQDIGFTGVALKVTPSAPEGEEDTNDT